VIIPVRNEAAKIEQCLQAIFSQALKPYEVIVVDGHSTDGTVENARKFPVKVFYEDYYTRAGGCQVGVENAEGEYIAFTDADCIPDKAWLANLVREFDDGIAGVGGRYEDTGKDLWTRSFNLTLGTFASGAKSRSNEKSFTSNLSVCGANGLCRREDIQKVGGFSVRLSGAEDLELGHRLSKIGKLLYVPDAVVLHNHSRGFRDSAKQMYRYGGWRRESRLWDLQAVVPLVIPLVLLSLIVTRWVFLGLLLLYLAIIIVMGMRFAVQESNLRYLVSIPVAYIVEHSCYIVGFWKELIKPRKKGVPWKK